MPKTRSKDDLHEDLSASSKNYVCHPNQPSKSHLIPPPTPSNHSTDPPQVRIRCLQPHQPRSGLAATPPVVKTHRLQPHTTPGQDSSSPTTPPQARTRHLQPYQPRSGLIVSNALNFLQDSYVHHRASFVWRWQGGDGAVMQGPLRNLFTPGVTSKLKTVSKVPRSDPGRKCKLPKSQIWQNLSKSDVF